MHLDPNIIRQQIDNLLQAYPDLLDDEGLRTDMLEGSTDLNEFLRQVERLRQSAVGMAVGIESNINELNHRKGRFERRVEAMRELIFKLMEWAHLRKIELPEATMSIRAGTSRVIITDESKIPKKFQRVKIEPDKSMIKDALNDGKSIPGAELSNAPEVLSIRTK